jgi:hypothetical protein
MRNDSTHFVENKIQTLLVVWSICWLAIAGGSIYVLPQFGADHLNRFYFTSIYFFSFAIIGAIYYKINETLQHKAPFKDQLVLMALASLIWITICLLVNNFFQIGSDTYNRIISSTFYFPLFQIETLVTKLCDISFQQVFIFGLLKKLKEQNQSNTKAMTLFGICFFIIHLPLFFNLNLYALYLIIPSIFAGLIFSYLILNFRYGHSMSFAVHLLFYILIGIYFRL